MLSIECFVLLDFIHLTVVRPTDNVHQWSVSTGNSNSMSLAEVVEVPDDIALMPSNLVLCIFVQGRNCERTWGPGQPLKFGGPPEGPPKNSGSKS